MPDYVNTDTLALVRSRPESRLPAGNWVELSRAEYNAARAIPGEYREWTGSAVQEMDASEKAAVDAAALQARRDAAAAQLEQQEDILRAFMLIVLDELNAHSATVTAHLDAVDAATSLGDYKSSVAGIADLPQRTEQQLRTAIRNRLGD